MNKKNTNIPSDYDIQQEAKFADQRERYLAATRKIVTWGIVAVLAVILIFVGAAAVGKSISRYQKRADAKNRVLVTQTEIQRAEMQAKINKAQIAATQAEAEKRVVEAEGIRKAQDLIAKTLTDKYIQHEAIQAMEKNPSKVIYIPSGENGVPLVQNVSK